jgi:hypothetical protein
MRKKRKKMPRIYVRLSSEIKYRSCNLPAIGYTLVPRILFPVVCAMHRHPLIIEVLFQSVSDADLKNIRPPSQSATFSGQSMKTSGRPLDIVLPSL